MNEYSRYRLSWLGRAEAVPLGHRGSYMCEKMIDEADE